MMVILPTCVRKPKNIKEIYQIDKWARLATLNHIS